MSQSKDTLKTFTEVVNKDDIFIAVMGLSGSGKSSLIASCTKQDVVVGHDLSSCTTAVSIFSYDHISRSGKKTRVHLVDTPGFNDPDKSDVEILQEVVFWLSQAFDNGFFLDGIVYLHNIVLPRFSEVSKRSLEILKALCGPQSYKCVYLASTFWDDAQERGHDQLSRCHDHHDQLVNTYWQELISNGAQYRRPPGSSTDSFDSSVDDWTTGMVDHFVNKSTKHVLQIQSEMRSPEANLRNTSAAITAGELWRLDDKNKGELPLLDRTKGQLNSIWTQAALGDVRKLTTEIDTLKQSMRQNQSQNSSQRQATNVFVNVQNHVHGLQENPEEKRRKELEEQIERLEQAKARKLASYGFWVNVSSAAFGGVSAVMGTVSAAVAVAAPLGMLAACNVM